MNKKIIACILTMILLLSVLAGCGQSGTVTLRVNEVTHSIFYAPFYAAIELGFFIEKGISIELTNGGGSDKSMTALLTGQADIGFMGPETAVYVKNEGEKDAPVIIAQITQRDGSFLVGKTKDEAFTWDKVIGTSVIGGRTGGMPEMTLEYVLKKQGIQPGRDVTIRTDVSFDLMGGAFLAGQDDYVALFEPNASAMEQAGEGYIVASIGKETPSVAYTAMMVTPDFRDKNTKVLQDFTDVLREALSWVSTHTDAEIASAIAPSFPDSDIRLITAVVGNYKAIDAWKTTPETTKEDYEQLLNVIEEAGIITERPAFEAVVDNRFAQK